MYKNIWPGRYIFLNCIVTIIYSWTFCMNLKEILKILFVSVSSYFLLAKLHLAYLNNFLFCSRVLKHNQYVEIKQFFKVGSKQNNVSTFTWLIKFLVINARYPRLWEEVTFLQFCLHKEVRNLSNI